MGEAELYCSPRCYFVKYVDAQKKICPFNAYGFERMGLQMMLIRRAPTHHPLSLTTYGRDMSEDGG